jgi:ADP-ribose pyrophosphatase YjhB (NUDIX family)
MTQHTVNTLIVASLVLVRTAEGVLLVKQNVGAGLWGIPGGHMDPSETVEQAAVREMREETGLSVELGRVVGFYTVPSEQAVSVVFEAVITGGELQRVTHETADARFFAPGQLPAEFRRGHRQRVLDFLSDGKLPMFRVQ